MKMKQYSKTILWLFILGLIACKKGDNGPQGPVGAQGEKGAKGEIGPVGPAGKDGSIMYSGDIAPALSMGKVGDYYLNRVTGQLFGPKTTSSWGASIGLKGAAGSDGKNGSKTLSGNGAPAATQGTVGDFYLDKAACYLYGPKTTSWGPALELKGKDGNANVRSYIFTNPWNVAYISGTISFPLIASAGAFNYTTKELTDNMIQMYVGSLGLWTPANGDPPSPEIHTSFFIYPQNRVVVFEVKKTNGSSFGDISELKNYFDNDLTIKIFVITATSTTRVGGLAPGSPELKAALAPYLENKTNQLKH